MDNIDNNYNIEGLKPFTLFELEKYNGEDGMPTYVAVDGIVYDVSDSSLWPTGEHFGSLAGRDLTIVYKSCHAGRPRIGIFPTVGYIVVEEYL